MSRRFVDVDEFLKTTIEKRQFVFQKEDMLNECFIVETVYFDLAEALYNAAISEKDAILMMMKAPTSDAVEVVRCKDCKWFREYAEEYKQNVEKADGDCYHRMLNSENEQFWACVYDDYCSYGKRKETT